VSATRQPKCVAPAVDRDIGPPPAPGMRWIPAGLTSGSSGARPSLRRGEATPDSRLTAGVIAERWPTSSGSERLAGFVSEESIQICLTAASMASIGPQTVFSPTASTAKVRSFIG